MTNVLFYVQHLLGIGHLTRADRVCRALARDGFDVCVVTGGRPVPGFPAAELNHVALPAVVSADAGFSGLADIDGHPIDEAFRNDRRDRLLEVFRAFNPDVVVTEAFPFGRRQMRFELLPLIEAVWAADPRPLLVSSIRDILQERVKPGRNEETADLVETRFDAVLVHGDPGFVRLEETFPLADRIAPKLRYTGLVAPDTLPVGEPFDVVVSAGGGAVGGRLVEAALGAAVELPEVARWAIVTGPNLPQAEFDALSATGQSLGSGRVSVFRFREDLAALIAAARVSVSQAGYNTVCELLRAGTASVLVPFSAGGETEQRVRASRLAEMGLATVVEEGALDGARLADAIRTALYRGPATAPSPDLGGAAGSARELRALIAERG